MSLKAKVYAWLDENGDQGEKTRAMIVEATGINSVTVKSYLRKWRKEKKQQSSNAMPASAGSPKEQIQSKGEEGSW